MDNPLPLFVRVAPAIDNDHFRSVLGVEVTDDDTPMSLSINQIRTVLRTALATQEDTTVHTDTITGKWAFSLEGDEYTGPFDTEDEAHAEGQQAAEVNMYEQYFTARTKHPLTYVSDRTFGRGAIDHANEITSSSIVSDDDPIIMNTEMTDALGRLIREFLFAHAIVNRWGITNAHSWPVEMSHEP